MNLNLLRPGHRVGTRDGREAEVIGESPEGDALRVVCLVEEGPFGIRERTRAEELLGGGEVETLLGAEPPVSWRERLAVVLHYVPESEEDPAEDRPETLSGVPNGVKAGGAPHKRRSTISSEACGLWASWNGGGERRLRRKIRQIRSRGLRGQPGVAWLKFRPMHREDEL